MSWTHSSKLIAVGVLLAIALGVAGTAAAVSFTADDPEPVEVGETVEYEVEMTDVFDDQDDQWTLVADSGLNDESWTIVSTDRGEEVDRTTDNRIDLDFDDGIDTVTVQVQGEVPPIPDHNYEEMSQEEVTHITLSTEDGQQLGEWRAHRYTEESREARQKIDDAANRVGSDNADLTTAISLYNNGEFEQAIVEAEEIIDEDESEAQTQQLLLFGGAAVVLLAVLGGGYYAYSQRKKNTNKLQ